MSNCRFRINAPNCSKKNLMHWDGYWQISLQFCEGWYCLLMAYTDKNLGRIKSPSARRRKKENIPQEFHCNSKPSSGHRQALGIKPATLQLHSRFSKRSAKQRAFPPSAPSIFPFSLSVTLVSSPLPCNMLTQTQTEKRGRKEINLNESASEPNETNAWWLNVCDRATKASTVNLNLFFFLLFELSHQEMTGGYIRNQPVSRKWQ